MKDLLVLVHSVEMVSRAQPRILSCGGGRQSKPLWILEGSGGMLPQENLGVNILNFGEILL